jgi:hypothetical protein
LLGNILGQDHQPQLRVLVDPAGQLVQALQYSAELARVQRFEGIKLGGPFAEAFLENALRAFRSP